jgi:hypothetical protein
MCKAVLRWPWFLDYVIFGRGARCQVDEIFEAVATNFEKYCERFGQRVKARRLELNLTQEDMMERGFSLRHYQRIEAGRSVTLVTLWKLAQALKTEPAELVGKLR